MILFCRFPRGLVIEEFHIDFKAAGFAGLDELEGAVLSELGAALKLADAGLQSQDVIPLAHHLPLSHVGDLGGVPADGKAYARVGIVELGAGAFLLKLVVIALLLEIGNGGKHFVPGVQILRGPVVPGRHGAGGYGQPRLFAEEGITHIHVV